MCIGQPSIVKEKRKKENKNFSGFNRIQTRDVSIPVQRSNKLINEATTGRAGHFKCLSMKWIDCSDQVCSAM